LRGLALRIAYIIIAYKNLGQVQRLIGRLDDRDSHFVIMLDVKVTPSEVAAFEAATVNKDRVQVVHKLSIGWGRFSLTQANILGLQELFAREISFDYVFSLSGQDYPIVSRERIRKALEEAKGASFLEHDPFPIHKWIDGGKGRIYSWNIFLWKRFALQLPKATVPRHALTRMIYATLSAPVPWRCALPNGMHPFGGSMHWILSREAALYVRDYLLGHPEYVTRFRATLVSDEIFFQTILANSPLRGKLINNDQHYLCWPGEHAASPAVLTMRGLPAIQASGMLFARKFDSTKDPDLLDAMDALADMSTG